MTRPDALLVTQAVSAAAAVLKVQAITRLSVTRAPQAIRMRIELRFASVPVVELFRMVSGDPVLDMVPANFETLRIPLLAGPGTQFTVEFKGLRPATRYWYRIKAGGGQVRRRGGALLKGWAATLDRLVEFDVSFATLLMDGDGGSPGEVAFCAVIYDGERQRASGFGSRESRSDGSGLPFSPRYLRPAGPPFSLRGAPDNLTLLCGADEDDQSDVSFGLNLDPGGDWIPETPPSAPNSGETENHDFAYAVQQLTNLPGTPGSTVLAPIDFRTRPGVLAFEAVWSVRVSVFDPFPTPREVIPRLTPRQRLLAPGEAARLRGSDGRRRVVAPGQEGLRIGTGRRDRETWILLEGPRPRQLLLDAGPEGRLDLVLWDDEGHLHGLLDGLAAGGCVGEGPGAKWVPLGGPFAAPPLGLRDGQGQLQLFALDADGRLLYRPLDMEPRDWQAIGGPFRGALVGWAPVDGLLTLAAEDGDGRIWVGTPAGDNWRPFSAGHRRLVASYGDAIGDGRLVAADDEDALWVRRLDPESPWEPLGSLEEAPAVPTAEPHQTPPPSTTCSDQAG
ncbi:hypothetical protein KBY82_12910 [Cyanobium sp. AMD-g]|uniref:hypothetical protein n=1 Tax=Cyanobium sp. AMD-g TaxID=2823699 RepID=UPI0020CEB77C|nr:hypothetical protein [Cyanobium sp. AMD-g]MCP9931681.1 hypothetical protein [Cyanobium sp. AMD-g]